MVTLEFTAELVAAVLTTGTMHRRTEVLDGVPPGHVLTRAFVRDGRLVLDFEDVGRAKITKSVSVRQFMDKSPSPTQSEV